LTQHQQKPPCVTFYIICIFLSLYRHADNYGISVTSSFTVKSPLEKYAESHQRGYEHMLDFHVKVIWITCAY